MPHKPTSLLLFFVPLLAAPLACTDTAGDTSRSIAHHFAASGRQSINLAEAVPGPWEKVCILGPYSDNKTARVTLGFEWNAQAKTSIQTNEGIALLLFVRGSEVLEHAEHSRRQGDFSNLSGKCFSRAQSVFVHNPSPPAGWPGLFGRNAS